MKIDGLHLLLTYQCNFSCDHCFVWGGPGQSGTMSLRTIEYILEQAADLGGVEWIYFEGGEPFLYYAVMVRAIETAAAMGFKTGVVTNGYWSSEAEDAEVWLKPLAGLVGDLTISSDYHHWGEKLSRPVRIALAAAERLNIPAGTISVARANGQAAGGEDEADLMFRGRAVEKLAGLADGKPWASLDRCPYEDLREPGRLHVDPFGNLHLCQGLTVGNIFRDSLSRICSGYDPEAHPIAGPLLKGGPAELARCYSFEPELEYADACHLCYLVRRELRTKFPDFLGPDQMYGLESDQAD